MVNSRTDTTQRSWSLAVAIGLLTAVGHDGVARHGFVFDDHTLIVQNESIRQLNVGAFLTAPHSYTDPEGQFGSYRPLRTLSFAVDYRLWGLDAAGFHRTNIALHALNAALVFLLAHRLTGRLRLAAIAALVFAFHPVQAETVARASCRGELLYSFFALLAFGLFWRTHVLRLSYILSLLCFCAALFSKEFAVMLPVLMAAAIGLGLGRQEKWTTLRLVIPFCLIALVFLLVPFGITSAGGQRGYWGGSLVRTLCLAVTVFARYVSMSSFPFGLQAVYMPRTPESALEPGVLTAAALVVVALALAFTARQRAPMFAFGVAWFFIALLPVSNLIPFPQKMAEHFLYLPVVGFCLALAWGVNELTRPRAALWCGVGLAAVFCANVGDRGFIWQSDLRLWRSVVQKAPDIVVGHLNLGAAYARQDRHVRAIHESKKAIAMSPGWGRSYLLLGNSLAKTGATRGAIEAYESAVRHGSASAGIWNELGLLHQKLGEREAAEQRFRKAIELATGYALAHYNLGNLLAELGRTEEAAAAFLAAIGANPRYAAAHHNLGNVCAALKRYDLAEKAYRNAAECDPSLWHAHLMLGLMAEARGNLSEAKARFSKVLELDPGNEEARARLSRLNSK